MKACLIFGFTEGHWHGKRMRQALQQLGIELTADFNEADYLIAHSGGCFNVPTLRDDQYLMLINPPYWPGKSLRSRGIAMTGQIARLITASRDALFHFDKTLHNLWYLIRHQRMNRLMVQRATYFDLETEIKHRKTILVRNDDDPWLTPQLDQLQSLNPDLQILRLPGAHDDCWLHPLPYINALMQYQGQL